MKAALVQRRAGPGPPCAVLLLLATLAGSGCATRYARVVAMSTTPLARVEDAKTMVDYGPAGPTVQYPADVILSNDANFGFWPGDGIGPNNGNCSADTGYPLKSAANPGTFYIVEAGSTCQEPVPGLATFTTTTILATPAYTNVTGSACSSKGVPSPCYTVRWTNNYQIRQDWNIFLE